jgi:dihydrofolate reductase
VSSTVDAPCWSNATLLKGDVVAAAAELKRTIDGDILVYASYQLARALIDHDLVDELRLFLLPVVVGGGERLFGETGATKAMRLRDNRTIGAGLTHLTYEVVAAG